MPQKIVISHSETKKQDLPFKKIIFGRRVQPVKLWSVFMISGFKIIVFVLLLGSFVFAQNPTREQKLNKISELNDQIQALEKEILQPEASDSEGARRDGFEAFRLMPRETYDRKLMIQGGGSFYSFTTKSHDYQKIAQIGLERNSLKVGFAGADYGFIFDLGETALGDVSKETPAAFFLAKYKPPTDEPQIRIEQRKAWNYELNGLNYKTSVPAVVGHSYVLRSISFDRADVLVAFKIQRKDADGSLIIFWKLLEDFEKPLLARNQ